MNLKIIFKQIHKSFLINWKLFLMVIIFCSTILAVIFGSLSFAVQFNNQIYQPVVQENAFSVGFLRNTFSISTDEKNEFKTSQEFENYFLEQINEIGEIKFDENDLKEIYENDGYVNWVTTDNEDHQKKAGWEKLINYSADFLGNIRFKIMNKYLQTQKDWTFKLRNNQWNVAKIANNFQKQVRFYTTNLSGENQQDGILPTQQKIENNSDYISAYVGEKQIGGSHQIGDIVTLSFGNNLQTKIMKVKIVGTFVDYVIFGNTDQATFLIDNADYFNFVKENFRKENQEIDYSIIDYRNYSWLSAPALTLLTYQQGKPMQFIQQFSAANKTISKIFFNDFDGQVLSDEFYGIVYLGTYQNNLMISFTMIGISLFLMALFFLTFYFLVAETIKKDSKISFFLNGLGMNYWEISFIQIARLTIPILVSFGLAIGFSFLTKQLFWITYAESYSIILKTFYFNWLTGVIFFSVIILVFFLLFFLNFLINHKLVKHQGTFEQITFTDQIWMKMKKIFQIKNPKVVMGFAYGAKNTFQNLLITLIGVILFTTFGFSMNFNQNIQNISEIPAKHYAPIQSISHSSGPMVEKDSEDIYHPDYQFTTQELTPIGAEIDLKNSSWVEIKTELEKLLADEITNSYLSSNLIRQITPEIITEINENVNDENLKSLLETALLMNEELRNNFGWKTGFNVNFGQWNNQFLTSNDHHFLNFEGSLYEDQTDDYLTNFTQAYAVNETDSFYKKEFTNLFDNSLNSSDNDEPIINAYFPMQFQKTKFLKMKVYLNQEIDVNIKIRNVGINKFASWDKIFILNQKQFFEVLTQNLKDESSVKEIFKELLANGNLDQLDNGVYSTISTPYFYRNVLLRSDGKGEKIENFLSSWQKSDLYGLNFDQIKQIIVEKMSQFNQLIKVTEILLILLMAVVTLILIYLVTKENESYFQNFKALGYSAKEISFFLLPWYLGGLILASIVSSLIVTLTTNLIDQQLSSSLEMYLDYKMTFTGTFALVILPLIFIILITIIIYQFVKKVSLQNAI